jgi:hypothetical protein
VGDIPSMYAQNLSTSTFCLRKFSASFANRMER